MMSNYNGSSKIPTTDEEKNKYLQDRLNNTTHMLSTSGYSLADKVINSISGNPPTSIGEALANNVTTTLQPVVNILTIIQSPYFWLNVGGIIIGLIIVLIAVQALMKQELLSQVKKAL